MSTLKIPLTDDLMAFVETETAAGGHSSASDFVLALVKEAQKKRAWEKAEELVLEGMQTPARPLTDEDWQKLYERVHHAKSVSGAEAMSANIIRRDQAIADLEALTDRIAQDRPKSAERFLKAVEKAFDLLARFPELGSRCEFRSPHLNDLRIWSVQRFKNYLIFYRPIENGIEIIRVVHGARDLESLFLS